MAGVIDDVKGVSTTQKTGCFNGSIEAVMTAIRGHHWLSKVGQVIQRQVYGRITRINERGRFKQVERFIKHEILLLVTVEHQDWVLFHEQRMTSVRGAFNAPMAVGSQDVRLRAEVPRATGGAGWMRGGSATAAAGTSATKATTSGGVRVSRQVCLNDGDNLLLSVLMAHMLIQTLGILKSNVALLAWENGAG